jgi:hypothetical protein
MPDLISHFLPTSRLNSDWIFRSCLTLLLFLDSISHFFPNRDCPIDFEILSK